jgi:small subunit ribosomal protein S21
MLIIELNNGMSVEKALKEYKRKYTKTKLIQELRSRKEFTKKSVSRRKEINKAKYIQSISDNSDK